MLEIFAGIAVVAYAISKQLTGQMIQGKRLILLPAILTVVGVVNLTGKGSHLDAVAIALIAASALIAIAIGIAQGFVMRLCERDGSLWGQMPLKSLWLWAMLIGSRVGIMVAAHLLGAHLSEGSSILFTLGLNRLTQAAVIGARAWNSGIPFAPEKDGQVFLGHIFQG
jgi:hypothetical protein